MARPSAAGSTPVRVRFAGFDLDEANATLAREGKPLALAPTPFALLCALARQPGALLSKDALLDQVWGHQFVSESVLKTAISDLRTVLGDDARQPRVIETVPRRGYRFIAVPIAQPRGPGRALSAASPAQESRSFVGRADALARLGAAWERAHAGTRSLAWVTGEPGIGKTTLIEHFIAGLGDVACARGQCVEHYGTGEPYLPVLEALADLCRRDIALPPLLRAVAPTWLLQLPWLSTTQEREALRQELSGVGPERMLREMGELLDRYTGERPLLLVTEDLHWSDRSTLHLIDYIARRRGGTRLMWLASFRLAEVVALDHPLNPLRHELRLHRLCEEIVLDPFSEREIADYVAAATPALAADDAFVRGLHERTDGVPLFVASVMADVSGQAADGGDAAVARELLANVAVPENLAAIIDHYIARLGSDERVLLSTAAVFGMQFHAETIAEATERDPAWVAETCERLARARVWVAAPHATQHGGGGVEWPYSFRHTLFRQVLYERTAPATRAQLHRKVGAALERERERGGPVAAAQLAMHFDRGREPMTALRYYAEAAEAALRGLSAQECMTLTERALGLLESTNAGTGRSALEILLCTLRGMAAFRLFGVGLESRNAYRRAYALLPDAPTHRARELLTHGYGFVLCQRAEYDEALTVAENAAAHAAAADVPLLLVTASNVEGQVHMMQGRPHAARARLERALPAIAAADPGADRQVTVVPQVMLLGLLALQLFHLGLVRQARDRLGEARLRAHEVNVPMARLVVSWIEALLEVRLGHADRVSALADGMRTLVEESALAQGGAPSQWFRGWADARRGDAVGGYRLIRAAYERNTALGMLAGGSEVLGYAAEALVFAGDLEGAQRELRHAFDVARAQDERIYLPRLYLTEAAIARGRRDPAAAEEALRRALAEAREQEAPWHVLAALVDLCEHGNPGLADLDALATLLAHLPEAADTGPALRARDLIKARAPAPGASTP